MTMSSKRRYVGEADGSLTIVDTGWEPSRRELRAFRDRMMVEAATAVLLNPGLSYADCPVSGIAWVDGVRLARGLK
jgi:hypothetical protein